MDTCLTLLRESSGIFFYLDIKTKDEACRKPLRVDFRVSLIFSKRNEERDLQRCSSSRFTLMQPCINRQIDGNRRSRCDKNINGVHAVILADFRSVYVTSMRLVVNRSGTRSGSARARMDASKTGTSYVTARAFENYATVAGKTKPSTDGRTFVVNRRINFPKRGHFFVLPFLSATLAGCSRHILRYIRVIARQKMSE